MHDFEKELINRFLVAAAMAKADGFEHTAAAMIAVAKDVYDDIAARPSARKRVEFCTNRTGTENSSIQISIN